MQIIAKIYNKLIRFIKQIKLLDFDDRSFDTYDDRPNLQLAWWVKITTKKPSCTYYFGSFSNYREAKKHQSGYLEDLIAEKALGITAEIIYYQPQILTIETDPQ